MTIAGKLQSCFRFLERKGRAARVTLRAYDAVRGIPAHEPPLAGQSVLPELFDHIAALFATIRSEMRRMPVAWPDADTVFKLNAVSTGGKVAHAEGENRVCDGLRRRLHSHRRGLEPRADPAVKAFVVLYWFAAPAWAATIDFVSIPPGEFVMGATDETAALFELPDGDASLIADERPAHRVRISRGFELARTEITQGQWFDLMKTRPGPVSFWKRRDWRELPVVSVSWNDAQRFVAALNKRENTTRYRLPTEAEWEYAARAGSASNRPFPDAELAAHAWYLGNSGDVPHPVGRLQANAWGLHDMLGNAWEWVADRYQPDYYANSPLADPPGPSAGERRVRRGGSYHCAPYLVRVNYRAADTPDTRYSVIGFRVLRESLQ